MANLDVGVATLAALDAIEEVSRMRLGAGRAVDLDRTVPAALVPIATCTASHHVLILPAAYSLPTIRLP